jgi:phytoene dehydrogenase-like protein
MRELDAIVIGSGPNGLAAAIVLARAGRKVTVFEAADTIGGGCRSDELTLAGFVHDVCSAIHPFAIASPLFKTLALERFGLEWIEPPVMVAHPLDGATAACVYRSIDGTANRLDGDAGAYRALFEPLTAEWPRIDEPVLGPLRWPKHPLSLARFGWRALRSASDLATRSFTTARARALFAGIAAHSMLPLDRIPTGAIGLALNLMAHVAGWPMPRGGAQSLANALAACLRSHGGEIVTGMKVSSLDDLPKARAVLCDLSPRPLLRIAGHRFPAGFRSALERYRYGMGVYKVDWALDAPVPWIDPECGRAGTVHLGGTLEEIAFAEQATWDGACPDRPFVLVTQPTLFDPSRAPAGKHVLWAYCHVPHGSATDMLARIEKQIEHFAPGFRERVIARAIATPGDIERRNPNLVGGDIAAGVTDMRQLFTRPTWRTYSTPLRGLYLCSAATPPGVGVHGMCGYFAAQLALRDVLRD